MSNRYFASDDNPVSAKSNGGGDVFTISKDVVDKVRKKRVFSEASKSDAKRPRAWKKKPDQFPGPAPIDPEVLEKHSRGDGVKPGRVRTKFGKKMAERREQTMTGVQETAAR
jgi:hypothetical protein